MSLGFLRVCGLVACAVLPSLGVTAAPTPTVPAMRPLPLDAGTPTGSLGGALRMLHDGGGRPGGDTAPSLSRALTADGRLRPTARGSFSAAGYTLVSEPGRAPRFVASQAATGTYSGAFRANVPNDEIATIAVLSPTEFVVGGSFIGLGGDVGTNFLARWDGSAWQALGGGVDNTVWSLAVSGSDLYVGGDFTQAFTTAGDVDSGVGGTNFLARWDGSSWHALGGGVDNTVWSLAVSGADVYVGGSFAEAYAIAGDVSSGVAATSFVARWDGTAWHPLQGSVNDEVYALVVRGSDLYVGGSFTEAYAAADDLGSAVAGTAGVARWDGSAWQALGGGVDYTVNALAVSSGDVYVGGDFTQAFAIAGDVDSGVAGTYGVARWDGSVWHALGGGVEYTVWSLAISGTDVYVGGSFLEAYATPGDVSSGVAGTQSVARWDGSAWQALGGGVDVSVYALAISGSDVYVGGDFTQALAIAGDAGSGVTATQFLATWDGGAWQAAVPVGNGPGVAIQAIAVLSSTDFIVGGDFTDLGGNAAADYVARWDGSAWQALGGGVDYTVNALAVSGGDVYVGGAFSQAYATAGDAGSGVAGTYGVARWDGSVWHGVGGGVDGFVFALAVAGGEVVIGGSFSQAYATAGAAGLPGTDPVAGTMAVARWDGLTWQPLGGGLDNVALSVALVGTDVYVGGSFAEAYATPDPMPGQIGTNPVAGTVGVARWDGSAWQALGGGVEGFVIALAASGSDVYVAGFFDQAYAATDDVGSGVAGTVGVARWDGSAWQALGDGISGAIFAVTVSGSDVYVGGLFDDPSLPPLCGCGGEAQSVARWTGSAWQSLGAGVYGQVYALAVGQAPPASPSEAVPVGASIPALLIGGVFSGIGDGTPASNLTYYTEGANLPVELSAFTARASGTASALLRWTTESETRSAGFAVDHRVAGSGADATWQEVAFVAGRGTTSAQTAYTHPIDGLAPGRHAFRLRQIDLDGTTVVAGTVEVVIGRVDDLRLSIVGNASAAPRVRLDGRGEGAEGLPVTVEVFDMVGRRVSHMRVSVDGRRDVEAAASLAPGVYVVRASTAMATQTTTLVVR